MWSTCSIETGHASTQAPHVTQSQIVFTDKDVVRHALVTRIVRAYEEDERRRASERARSPYAP